MKIYGSVRSGELYWLGGPPASHLPLEPSTDLQYLYLLHSTTTTLAAITMGDKEQDIDVEAELKAAGREFDKVSFSPAISS